MVCKLKRCPGEFVIPLDSDVCAFCSRRHKGCLTCRAETGCTDDYYDYAEVLAFCGCDS